MLKYYLFLLLNIILLFNGCQSEKERLEEQLYICQQNKSNLWEQRRSLQDELYSIEKKLESSNKKIIALKREQNLTKQMIYLLANNDCEKAIMIAKSINQGWFDDFDKQILAQKELLSKLKENRVHRQQLKISKEKDFYNFMLEIIIFIIKILVILVLCTNLFFIIYLIYKGKDIQDKFIRALGVIAFLLLYFLASFNKLSIAELMLKITFSSGEIITYIFHDIIPFIIGGFFAILIKKQIQKDDIFSSRWLIIISTLLFCALLDVFINVKSEFNNYEIPVANTTFILGLFMTIFFTMIPNKSSYNK